jgi:hypothetical protein
MGILELFFGRKQEELRFDELEAWLSSREQAASREAVSKISSILAELGERRQEAKENLSRLGSAELFNKNITEREKQIMEGNRKAYIHKCTGFLERTIQPKAEELEAVRVFVDNYDKELGDFTRGSERAYYFLGEFFQNETGKAARSIKEMDNLIAQARAELLAHSGRLAPIKEIQQMLSALSALLARQKQLKKQERELSLNLKATESGLEEITARQARLKRSPGFRELSALTFEGEAKRKEIAQLEASLSEEFAVLERAMRKFSKLSTDEGSILPYLENPLSAFLADQNLKIIDLLQKIKGELESGALELKDKKQEKTLLRIEQLTRPRLSTLQARYSALLAESEMLMRKIEEDPVSRELEGLAKKEKALLEQSQRQSSDKLTLINEQEKISIQKQRELIKTRLEESFGVRLLGG